MKNVVVVSKLFEDTGYAHGTAKYVWDAGIEITLKQDVYINIDYAPVPFVEGQSLFLPWHVVTFVHVKDEK